jgi:amino acid transporter
MEDQMTRNIGTVDRVIRMVAGATILSLAFVGPHTLWGLLGLVPLITAIVGWCPPYAVFGINTCKSRRA